MNLYESGYGYTHLRLYTHVFMAFEAGIFLYLFIDSVVAKKLMPYFALFSYIYGVIIFSFLNFLRPDSYIATQNIKRFENENKPLDIEYLLELSSDAYLRLSDIDFETKNIYLCEISTLDKKESKYYDSWKEFNFSRYNNHKKIEKLTKGLNKDKCGEMIRKKTEDFLNKVLKDAKEGKSIKKYFVNSDYMKLDDANINNYSISIKYNRDYYSYKYYYSVSSHEESEPLFYRDYPYYLDVETTVTEKFGNMDFTYTLQPNLIIDDYGNIKIYNMWSYDY